MSYSKIIEVRIDSPDFKPEEKKEEKTTWPLIQKTVESINETMDQSADLEENFLDPESPVKEDGEEEKQQETK